MANDQQEVGGLDGVPGLTLYVPVEGRVDGLQPGDRVIVSGQTQIATGDRVRVVGQDDQSVAALRR